MHFPSTHFARELQSVSAWHACKGAEKKNQKLSFFHPLIPSLLCSVRGGICHDLGVIVSYAYTIISEAYKQHCEALSNTFSIDYINDYEFLPLKRLLERRSVLYFKSVKKTINVDLLIPGILDAICCLTSISPFPPASPPPLFQVD